MFNWLTQAKTPLGELVKQFESASYPAATTAVKQLPLLAIDLELTGLNPRKDHIVSIGWVPIIGQEIVLGKARHYLINSPVSVGQSAIYHGVHDSQLTDASDMTEILAQLLSEYRGYIFVAHHSSLDNQFLRTACQRYLGKTPRFRLLDTMQIEWQRLLRQGKVVAQDALHLSACLNRHHLPALPSHCAIEDAYGCALLLLSQIKHLGPNATLQDLQSLSRG